MTDAIVMKGTLCVLHYSPASSKPQALCFRRFMLLKCRLWQHEHSSDGDDVDDIKSSNSSDNNKE